MFGFGNARGRARNETFSPNRIRGAAIVGLGMLAWRWWRNRHETGRPATNRGRPHSESPRTPATDAF
jgi:hypothetical protein